MDIRVTFHLPFQRSRKQSLPRYSQQLIGIYWIMHDGFKFALRHWARDVLETTDYNREHRLVR
jgi:hypothetical protein